MNAPESRHEMEIEPCRFYYRVSPSSLPVETAALTALADQRSAALQEFHWQHARVMGHGQRSTHDSKIQEPDTELELEENHNEHQDQTPFAVRRMQTVQTAHDDAAQLSKIVPQVAVADLPFHAATLSIPLAGMLPSTA